MGCVITKGDNIKSGGLLLFFFTSNKIMWTMFWQLGCTKAECIQTTVKQWLTGYKFTVPHYHISNSLHYREKKKLLAFL